MTNKTPQTLRGQYAAQEETDCRPRLLSRPTHIPTCTDQLTDAADAIPPGKWWNEQRQWDMKHRHNDENASPYCQLCIANSQINFTHPVKQMKSSLEYPGLRIIYSRIGDLQYTFPCSLERNEVARRTKLPFAVMRSIVLCAMITVIALCIIGCRKYEWIRCMEEL